MALDPSTDALLKNLAAQNGPAIHQMDVATARAVFAQLVPALAGPAEDVHKVEDRRIPGPDGEIPVRIYWPRDSAGKALPVLVQYHGGGWVIGDLGTHDTMCRYFAKHADVIVVAVDYRLAPEHKFPAGVDDCIAATAWVHANAASLGADAARLAVTGDSAGGNMAAVVAQALQGKVAFQLLIYPATDFGPTAYPSREQFGTGEYFLSSADMAWFGAHLSDDPGALLAPKGSPIAAASLAGLAPALTVTAGYDPLCDEGKAYADKPPRPACPPSTSATQAPSTVSRPSRRARSRPRRLAFMAAKLKAALA